VLRVWEDFNRGETWREVSATGSSGLARAAAAQLLTEVREVEVGVLEALRANAKALELLRTGAGYVTRRFNRLLCAPSLLGRTLLTG
jgi:hypothetical protein